MSRKARLDKLEGAVTPPKSEYERRVDAEWALYAEPLALTMSEAHVWALVRALEEPLSPDDGAYWLYRFFSTIMLEHWNQGRPLTLPHAVGEAVMRYHARSDAWDCEDCGYRTPMKPPTVPNVYVGEPVSPTCLLCGGKVGRYAYWEKHKRKPGVMYDPLLGSRGQQEATM